MTKRSFNSLAEYLSQTGVTQAELATRVGISQGQLSHIVRRFIEPRLGVALRLHEVTGVPLQAFVVQQPGRVA